MSGGKNSILLAMCNKLRVWTQLLQEGKAQNKQKSVVGLYPTKWLGNLWYLRHTVQESPVSFLQNCFHLTSRTTELMEWKIQAISLSWLMQDERNSSRRFLWYNVFSSITIEFFAVCLLLVEADVTHHKLDRTQVLWSYQRVLLP